MVKDRYLIQKEILLFDQERDKQNIKWILQENTWLSKPAAFDIYWPSVDGSILIKRLWMTMMESDKFLSIGLVVESVYRILFKALKHSGRDVLKPCLNSNSFIHVYVHGSLNLR